MSRESIIKRFFIESLSVAEASLKTVPDDVLREWAIYGFASYLMGNPDDEPNPAEQVAIVRRFIDGGDDGKH